MPKDPIVTATWVIAIATVVNVVVSAGLWKATRNSVEIARRVYEATNRPYIGTERIDLTNDTAHRVLDIAIVLKNYGTVPGDILPGDWLGIKMSFAR